MFGNTKPVGIIAPRTVTKHIPSKPHREIQNMSKKGGSSCNKLNHKKIDHFK
jgi:hypothetical protein